MKMFSHRASVANRKAAFNNSSPIFLPRTSSLADRQAERADATVTLDRAALNRLVLRELTFADAIKTGLARVEGDAATVTELFDLFDDFTLMFEVMEPRRDR